MTNDKTKTFDVMGVEIKARPLDAHGYSELAGRLGSQGSFENEAKLMNIMTFGLVIWLGTRQDTPKLKDEATVNRVVGIHNISEWSPVVSYILRDAVAFFPNTTEDLKSLLKSDAFMEGREV